jgi:hypothetical protein
MGSAGATARGVAVNGWWREYFVCEGEELSSVHVDLALRDRAPVEGLPILTGLTVPLSGEGWQVTAEEGHALAQIAEELTYAAAPRIGDHCTPGYPQVLRLVGRRTRSGQAELWFHGEKPLDRRHLAQVARHLPGATIHCTEREDPRWRFYLDTLHPGAALDPLLLTAVQLEERERCGDDHAAPRAVDHLVRFRDAGARERFVALLRERRGRWDLRPFEAGGERRFGVECTTEHTLDRWVIDAKVVDLSGHADALGGVYDGWGAPRVGGGGRGRSS